jgi:chromosome segregation ATPase
MMVYVFSQKLVIGDVLVMGVYINRSTHPNLFQTRKPIETQNQDYFHSDYMRDLLTNQKELQESLENALKSFKITFQKHQYSDDKRWRDINKQIQELSQSSEKHDSFMTQAREWLHVLENNNVELQKIIQSDSIVKENMKEEITRIHESNREMVGQLASYENLNEQLVTKMNELVELYQSMSTKITEQSNKQDTVIDNLEKQEAMMEKSYRQLNNLRSILYERTSYVAEKIEESYKLTSSILYKFLSGSDKPLEIMVMNHKRDGVKKREE